MEEDSVSKRKQEKLDRLVPHEDAVRESISRGLINISQVIDLQRIQIDTLVKLNSVRALSGKEERFLEEAREKLMRVEQICRVIGERNAGR